MKPAFRIAAVAVLAACVMGASFVLGASASVRGSSAAMSSAPDNRVAFNQAMRKLWEDHITWTRLYIVSAAAGLPDQSATADRLFRNQVDIGNAIKPYYGEAAGDHLTSLLHDHIVLAAQILAAAKAGDSAGVTAASAAWYANADQIAEFLNAANPKNWPLDEMKAMMKAHLDLTLQEAVDRLHGDYTADIADYDKVHVEILSMADKLSAGIIAQFPQKFAA